MILVTRARPFCYHLKSLGFFEDPRILHQSIIFSPLLEASYTQAPCFNGIVVITSGQALFACQHLKHNVLWCIGEDVAKICSDFKQVFCCSNVQELFLKLCQSYPLSSPLLYIHGDITSWPLDTYLRSFGFQVGSFQGYCLTSVPLKFTPPRKGPIYVTCYSQRLMALFLNEKVSWQSRAVALCLSTRIAKSAGKGWAKVLIKTHALSSPLTRPDSSFSFHL